LIVSINDTDYWTKDLKTAGFIGNSRTSHKLHVFINIFKIIFLLKSLITFLLFVFLSLSINFVNHFQALPDYIAPCNQLIECVMQLFDFCSCLINKLLLFFSLLMNLFHNHSFTLYIQYNVSFCHIKWLLTFPLAILPMVSCSSSMQSTCLTSIRCLLHSSSIILYPERLKRCKPYSKRRSVSSIIRTCLAKRSSCGSLPEFKSMKCVWPRSAKVCIV
jgi:hypothetical protein